MTQFNYKDGELIRVGDTVTIDHINDGRFTVNGYVNDDRLKPPNQIDVIGRTTGGDPVQLVVNMELLCKK